VKAEFMARW